MSAGSIADDPALPDTWIETEHIAWAIDMPGLSWSLPVVWDEHIFITTAISANEEVRPIPGLCDPGEHNGKIFLLNEDGDTFDVKAGPECEILHKNSLNEMSLAIPAVARGSLILRT